MASLTLIPFSKMKFRRSSTSSPISVRNRSFTFRSVEEASQLGHSASAMVFGDGGTGNRPRTGLGTLPRTLTVDGKEVPAAAAVIEGKLLLQVLGRVEKDNRGTTEGGEDTEAECL